MEWWRPQTTGPQDYGTTRLRDYKSTGLQEHADSTNSTIVQAAFVDHIMNERRKVGVVETT